MKNDALTKEPLIRSRDEAALDIAVEHFNQIALFATEKFSREHAHMALERIAELRKEPT